MATASSLKIFGPPLPTTDINDVQWRRWLTDVVWQIVGAGVVNSGPQGTFPQLQTGKARFTNDNAFQELLNVNQGLYVNYSSSVNNIIYGYACNVYRSAGKTFTVGAQINTWLAAGVTGGGFGVVSQVVAYPGSNSGLSANESAACDFAGTTSLNKWGYNAVFKNRLDGATKAYNGISSNLYNYWSSALWISSQTRGSDGALCGWNVGIQFTEQSLDAATPIAWNSTTTYSPGQVVSNGGVLWKCITSNTNVAPVSGNTWIQYTIAGTTLGAVGIDFCPMSTTAMGRMASAIRFRSSMYQHWDETGSVGTMFDATASTLRLCDNQGNLRFGVNVSTAVITTSQSEIVPGAGAAATNTTIGGSGPTVAAQDGWMQINFGANTRFIPVWK